MQSTSSLGRDSTLITCPAPPSSPFPPPQLPPSEKLRIGRAVVLLSHPAVSWISNSPPRPPSPHLTLHASTACTPASQTMLSIWGSDITSTLEWGVGPLRLMQECRGEGRRDWGAAEGATLAPALLPPGLPPCSRHPRGSSLHVGVFNLARRPRGSFLRGWNGERGREASEAFPTPCPGWGGQSLRSKPSWPTPRLECAPPPR